MRTFNRVALSFVVASIAATGGGLRAQPPARPPRAVPGEIIVKYKLNASPAERGRARASAGAQAVLDLVRPEVARAAGHLELVRVPANAATQAIIATLKRDPAVEYAEPNWIYTAATAPPNDPRFPQQWALENSGQAVDGQRGIADADIDVLEAWNTAPRASSVYIGVIDEGIDFRHPDLGVQPGGVIWTNPFDPVDGIDNDGNGYVDDHHGWDFAADDNSVYDGNAAETSIDAHGTHVAGTIGARTGNGIGVAGVSPGVVIIPAKFLGREFGTTAGAVMAVDYLTDLKVRHALNVVATNNSWTGGDFSQALLDAIARAARQGILFIVSSGNGGTDTVADDNDTWPSYPSSYDTRGAAGYDAVVAVTATGQSDELMPWANFGFTSVDMSAPGAQIVSTTPQNTYSYSSGTSMAAPHVTGAAALIHSARGLDGPALREALLGSVDIIPALSGRTATGGRLNLARAFVTTGSGAGAAEVVLQASDAGTVAGNWAVRADATAAGAARMQSANLGAAKIAPALASPASYFEMTFQADAGRPYHLWIRARAENNSWANDSVHVQFDRAVTAAGAAAYRIGTSSSVEINLEDCSGCGLSGWGWQDNGYGAGVLGPAVYFAASGTQRVRIQIREDGVGIDQIVLSSSRFVSSSPGALKNDTTILAGGGTSTPPAPPATAEVVLHAATDATVIAGGWTRTADATAASATRLQNPNAGAAKIVTPLANPTNYFELTFRADAGKPYHLWLRGKASGNSWANDSVHVQFNDAVSASGGAVYRIESTSALEVNLEDCSGCGLSGWGWQDNGYGAGVRGIDIRFAVTGMHTMRVQVREDGFGVDQIVLSAVKYLTVPPGALKNDATILARAGQ